MADQGASSAFKPDKVKTACRDALRVRCGAISMIGIIFFGGMDR